MPRWSKAWDNAVKGYPGFDGALPTAQLADDLSRVIRAAVRAVIPGRQQGKNLRESMTKAEKAAARALRSAAKRRES